MGGGPQLSGSGAYFGEESKKTQWPRKALRGRKKGWDVEQRKKYFRGEKGTALGAQYKKKHEEGKEKRSS